MADEEQPMTGLTSSDEQAFELPLSAAELVSMVQAYGFDEDMDDEDAPKHDMEWADAEILNLVVEFSKHHKDEPMKEIAIPLRANTFEGVITQDWYAEFSKKMTKEETLFKVLAAAHHMNIQPLVNLCSLRITFNLSGKNAEQIRQYLNLPADAGERHPWIDENSWS